MHRLILIAALSLLACGMYAQELTYELKWWGTIMYLDGERAGYRDVDQAMKQVPEARKQFNDALIFDAAVSAVGATGALMVVAGAIDDNNWTLMGIGLGMFVGTLPLRPLPKKKKVKAFDLYNSQVDDALGFIEIGVTARGIGLVYNF